MTIATAAAVAMGAVIYVGLILFICRFLSLSNGDIYHDNHA